MKVWHILFHPPSQTPVVAYFLSGLPGKNDYVCTSLTTHVCSYMCALTHFPPLPPMTTCGVIQVHQVRISREYPSKHTHSTIWNIIHECVTHYSLFSLINTCGVACSLSCFPGKNTQRASYSTHTKHTPWVCDTILSLSSLTNTCSVGYVTPTRFTRLEHTQD